MDWLIKKAISKMKREGIIDSTDEDIYKFGIECAVLKIIHYVTYIIIGILLHMIVPMIVSLSVFLPLGSKAGGYHARTRMRCYIISCCVVTLICILDKICIPQWLLIVETVISNVSVALFSPVANVNRPLSLIEIKKFKKQSVIILLITDIVIFICGFFKCGATKWLINGLMFACAFILTEIVSKKLSFIEKS